MKPDLSKLNLPGLKRAFDKDAEEAQDRVRRIESANMDVDTFLSPDFKLPHNQAHRPADKNAHFSEKIYLFPESYNALRREMEQYWKNLFHAVNPETGLSIAYCMVHDGPQFVQCMNEALDMVVQFDSGNISGICEKFLNALREKRGVSPL